MPQPFAHRGSSKAAIYTPPPLDQRLLNVSERICRLRQAHKASGCLEAGLSPGSSQQI